jgi:4-hydroxyphenylacetate 3-monooxygenase
MAHRSFVVVDREGEHPLEVDLVRCYNLGFTMRDAEKMQRHLEEVYKHGITELICARPPLVMPISPWAVLTDNAIEVQRSRTSGEVEIVTLVDDAGEVYAGVGSDHTDRALETVDIAWSKQVAPNVVAPTVWRWSEVRGHWDDVVMESWVVDDGVRVHYQSASVAEFWTPTEMLAGVRESVVPVPGALILFSGTVVSLDEQLRFGHEWSLRMHDPVLGRTITHDYHVTVLAGEVLNDGSATGAVAAGPALAG